MKAWVSRMENSSTTYTLSFSKNTTAFVQSCVMLPYLLLKGPATWDPSSGIINCINCTLYTCLNRSTAFNASAESIYLLKARVGLWMPVRMNRPWHDSPASAMLQYIAESFLKRTKRFIGTLIAVILGIIAVTATAAVAGVALQRSIQTTDFVADWHKDSEALWSSQRQIDSEIHSEIADLQQAVVLLGDQIVSLQ